MSMIGYVLIQKNFILATFPSNPLISNLVVFVNKGGVTRIKEFYDEKVIFKSKSTDDFGMPPVLASVLYY